MAGPRDAKAAFVRGGILNVIDARGNIWIYDTAVTTDAEGDEIVAPTGFGEIAEVSPNSIMVVDAASSVWTFDLNTGKWSEGPNLDERLEGEDKNTTEPWKRGHNVGTPPAAEEAPPPPVSRKKSKEDA